MNKVYVLVQTSEDSYCIEGCIINEFNVLKVFSSKEKANELCFQLSEQENKDRKDYDRALHNPNFLQNYNVLEFDVE